MTLKQKSELEALILALLQEKNDISLPKIAHAAGLKATSSTDRRAIQRVLTHLIRQERIEAQGKARARVYILKSKLARRDETDTFKGIGLSEKSVELLQYLSNPTHLRKPVGYNQEFLRSYIPNQTLYLSSQLRKELRLIGHVENIPRTAGTYACNILNRLLIDLSWNSSRLEGNTYSLLETKRLIELGESAIGKDATEAQMILNHKGAIEYIIESANESTTSFHEICSIHALLSENLLGDPGASGRIRNLAVGISGTTYLPLENPHILKECFELFIEKLNLINDPFEQSFFSLVQLSYLQAFEDVNKRTSRLAANIPLIKQNFKPLSFIDVTQKDYVMSVLGIYEKNDISLLRDLYVWAYQRSAQRYSALQQTLGEPNIFKLKYRHIIQEFIRTIILEKIIGRQVVSRIKKLMDEQNLAPTDKDQLFQIIETEIMSLHEGNIARFKIRPSEFQEWKKVQ